MGLSIKALEKRAREANRVIDRYVKAVNRVGKIRREPISPELFRDVLQASLDASARDPVALEQACVRTLKLRGLVELAKVAEPKSELAAALGSALDSVLVHTFEVYCNS
jgi:hypothetical protein